ncbi:hypothetical protein GCM10022225_77000 [Plantactinospora mayteni]|uniref:Uncharacterized protein n=1 Tax=Plantactinospora mayteni TaxID=566021 RepID=A0ABQ4F2K4_9ACTN|nr:hypothetical protein [Plantactinospora mayteni]GIH01133.1 hypothetical protein Pma05_77050 [Plantactinospora mayteni]
MIEEDRDIAHFMRLGNEGIEAPRSRILDVDRAMRTGRRQRWYGPTAVAAALVAALAIGVAVVPGRFGSEPAKDGGANMLVVGNYTVVAAEPAGLATLPEAPATIDPMGLYLTFGWLPDGYDHRQYHAGFSPGQTGSVAFLSADQDRDANSDKGSFSAVLYPRGLTPAAPQRDVGGRGTELDAVAAKSVNDNAASWITYSGAEGAETILRWRYAPDGWAQLRFQGNDPGLDARATAHRIASSMKLSSSGKVPLPVQATSLPTGLTPVSVAISDSVRTPRSWYASITLGTAIDPSQPFTNTLYVSVSPYKEEKDRTEKEKLAPAPNTTIDGQPAHRTPLDGPATRVRVGGSGGVLVEVDANGALAGQLGPDGVLTAYRGLRLVDRPVEWSSHLKG